MSKRYEMRFTGSGGQGVSRASVILAEAAILSGMQAIQSQAYGPEARGGMSRAETILSHDRIWFSKVISPNFLLALTQKSLDNYAQNVAHGAVVMIDSTLTIPAGLDSERVISIPILATAKDKVGKSMTANIVAVGAVNTALGIFDEKTLQEAVKRHIPRGTEELNMRALAEGEKLMAAYPAGRFRQDIA